MCIFSQLNICSLTGDNKTALFEPTSESPTGSIIAYAPYQTGAASDGDKIFIDIAQEQKFTWAKSMAQPDPSANLMLAKGSRGAGLSFYPVMAVLKIGKLFEEDTKLKSIEFRDLDGQPVCGAAVLTWKNGVAACEVTGGGNVLRLAGEQALSIRKDELRCFYLTVPARRYGKGFEITFVTEEGQRTTQTVGTTNGKELLAGVVYPVGDFVPDVQDVPDAVCELMPNAIMMTPENMDKIIINSKSERELHDLEGGVLYNVHGNPTWGYELDMTVHNFKELTMKFTPDPWYEQYYLPEILPTNSVVFNGGYNYKCADEWVTIHSDGGGVSFQPRLALESTSYTFALAKSCPSDVEVGMAYYEITNYDVSFEKEKDKELFKRGYISGLYGMVSIVPRYYPDNRPGYKELAVQHLGTYPALTEYKEFTGSIAPPADLHLKEHTIYCAFPVLLYDGKIAAFISDSGLHGYYGISYLYIQGLSDPNGVPYALR